MSFINYETIENAYPIIIETTPTSSLGYSANNKYPGFPPLMSDGRAVTASWQPEAILNAQLIESNGIKSNWQYRRYLTNNAKDVRDYNFLEASTDAGYFKRHSDLPSIDSNKTIGIVTPPYLYNSPLDENRPTGYESSDLKDLYLSREQLDSRRISPVITQQELLKYQGR